MSKLGRDCPKGDKCHWDCLQLPRDDGIGIAYWKCSKCGFIKHNEVEIK